MVQKANEKIEAVKTLSVLSALQWRHDMNDLMKRMGELRTSPEGIGGWRASTAQNRLTTAST